VSTDRDVLVLGAGIAGLSVARELALRGWKPLVLERDRAISHASTAAAGILAARGVVRSTVPGRMFYTRSLHAYPQWVESLSRESGLPVPLGEGDDWCFFCHGGRADRFRARLETESDSLLWEETESVPAPLRALLRDRPWRVFRFPQERWIRPAELLSALLESVRRSGTRILEHSGEVALARDGTGWSATCAHGTFRAPVAVVAAGPWTGSALDGTGWTANLVPVRGQLVRVPALHGLNAMVHLEDSFYVVPRGEWSVVGATVEHGVFEERTTEAGMADLQTRMRQMFPRFDISTAVESWAGIRPRTRDRVPQVGRLEQGLYLASGHYRSGISMAPRTGAVIADLLDGVPLEPDALDLGPLRPSGGWRRI
jgi:glycine oxidase